ncbi:MAG: thiamine pyrophosphate-binding protein [Ferruginibacter sp.]|nr:thiamine pyrophosphate-binding protein [Ferruginibacter sp.]
MIKASDYIATYIESRGVKNIFELSGGMITHILDSFHLKTKIKIVSVHHEQAAAFAADACGRVTGLPGIALATSGPGATNLLTGIASCYFDSSPAIFITGQVNLSELKGDRKIRQLGFQETDIVSMATPVTKKAYLVTNVNDLPEILEESFKIAVSGRPGPVLIDIPMNIQRMNIDVKKKNSSKLKTPKASLSQMRLQQLYKELQKAKKPLLLLGRGVRAAFAQKELKSFLELTKLPVVTSLLALDAVEYSSKQRVGFIGSYGNRWANIALGEADLVIVLGSRLDIRQTGADTAFFQNRTIFHIDCEAGEINNRLQGCIPVIADVKLFLSSFCNIFNSKPVSKRTEWFEYIDSLQKKWPDHKELMCKGINPNYFMHVLSQNSKKAKAYVADVGAHQMWAAQSLEIKSDQLFLTSGGMGAMGFALPAAIGACLSLKQKPVVAIIGDGCMQINLQELQTIIRNQLPVKIVVINNESLGMITQFQQSYFDERYQSTFWGYSAPDFEKVAKAYGINSKTIKHTGQIAGAVQWLWSDRNKDKPVLLQVMIEPLTNIYPKIAFGKPITEMEPFFKPTEMEST